MKLLILIFNIILLFNFINYIECEISVKDVTIKPILVDFPPCVQFKPVILVSDESSNSFYLSVELNTPSLQGLLNVEKGSLNNLTTNLFFVSNFGIPVGDYNISFIAKNSNTLESKEFFIQTNCKSLSYKDIEYKNLTTRSMELDVFGKVSTFIEIVNPKETSLEYGGASFSCSNGCSFRPKGRYAKIQMDLINKYVNDDFNAAIVLNYDYINSIYVYPKLYFKSNVYDQISNFKIYPNAGTISLVSNNLASVFTFESNLTTYYPYYIQKVSNQHVNNFNFRPISSSNQGKTIKYIGFINTLESNNDYSIFSQKYDLPDVFYSNTFIFNTLPFDPIPTTASIRDSSNYFTIEFQFSKNYYYTPFKVHCFNRFYFIKPLFALGFGDTSNFSFKASFFKEPYTNVATSQFQVSSFDGTDFSGGFSVSPNINMDYNFKFDINSIEIIKLVEHYYILRIKVTHPIPIYKHYVNEIEYDTFYLLDNPNGDLLSPTFDLIVNGFTPIDKLYINGYASYSPYTYYDINLSYYKPPEYNSDSFGYLDISYSKILYKKLDVTNKTAGNILYFNFTEAININTPISLVLFNPKSPFQKNLYTNQYPEDAMFPAKYNSTIEMFQVEFFVKANSHQGQMPYALFLNSEQYIPSNILSDSAQFTIISKNEDVQGPIIKTLTKFSNSSSFGWNFEIVDDYNGFESGYFTVKGKLDNSVYDFQLFTAGPSSLGNNLVMKSSISIKLEEPCISQDYFISNITLIDYLGYNSTFTFANYINCIEDSLSNPLINYIGDLSVLTIQTVCNGPSDSTPPELVGFQVTFSNTPLDVASRRRNVYVELTVTDLDSGIKKDQIPTIYFSTTSMNIHECVSPLITIVDSYTLKFSYTCTLPVGFGYPFGATISVGTVVNNGGTFVSFSTEALQTSGVKYSIDPNEIIMTTNLYPVITGASKFTEDGGELWIYGRGFTSLSSITIQYSNSTQIQLQINQNLRSAIQIINLPPSTLSFYVLYIEDQTYIDQYRFTPSQRVEIVPIIDESSESTSTSNSEEIPANPDQQCKGNPKCGGPSKGFCSKTGCICFSPYIGDDCSSKIIIVPQPSTNQTDPSTGIDIGGGDDSSSGNNNNNIVYKSFISLVSLRELDISGKTIQDNKFEKWNYNKLSNNTHQYQTTIKTSKITATLQWFESLTNITFANQPLTMNPSSMKYTITIENYPFKSELNSLELIMSASFESSKTDNICSSQQFGNTSNSDNSNYMVIQVDNHSLYGRFIKRGIFDQNKQIRSISNRLIKSDKSNTEYSSNTLIAIQMGYFSTIATIDPDFSIIINSNSASSKSDNSVCSNKGLSPSKIAGIVIGSVAFAAVIVISVSYYFIKKRNQKQLISKMQQKLSSMN